MGHVHLCTPKMTFSCLLVVAIAAQVCATSFTDASENEGASLPEVAADKRARIDRYGFLSQLGKRAQDQTGALDDAGDLDGMMMQDALQKRTDEMTNDEEEGLDKRSKMDQYGFAGMLGKRGMDRYSFYGALGKRAPSRNYNINTRGLDRYAFASALGKRGFSEGSNLDDDDDITELDKRGKMDRYSFFGALGKRGFRLPMGFSGQLGKRRMDLKGFLGQLGKRADSDDLRPRRATRRWRPRLGTGSPTRRVRGLDKYSFMSRLGKRVPNYKYFSQLGKRADSLYNPSGPNFGYDEMAV